MDQKWYRFSSKMFLYWGVKVFDEELTIFNYVDQMELMRLYRKVREIS